MKYSEVLQSGGSTPSAGPQEGNSPELFKSFPRCKTHTHTHLD